MSANGSESLLNIPDSTIKQLNKSDLIKKVFELSSKVVANAGICSLCEEIKTLSEMVSQMLMKNNELDSDITISKNANIYIHPGKYFNFQTCDLSQVSNNNPTLTRRQRSFSKLCIQDKPGNYYQNYPSANSRDSD